VIFFTQPTDVSVNKSNASLRKCYRRPWRA